MSRLDLVDAIFDAESVEQFRALIASDPQLLEEETVRELDGPPHAAGYAEQFARIQALLRHARSDPDAAWERHEAWLAESQRAGTELERRLGAAEVAYDAERFDEALAEIEEALPLAERYGVGAAAYALHALRGRSLMRRGGDRGANVDAAIDALEQALRHSLAGDDAAYVLDLLGSAHAQRPRGDHAENVERAIAAQRQGLDELGSTSPPHLLAITRTNLAATLLGRQRGDRVAAVREAISLCRAALDYRSPFRDGVDWAYTQLNLAGALERLADLTGDTKEAAVDAFEQVIAHAERIADASLVGAAHASIGSIRLDQALPDAEAQLEAWEDETLDELFDNRELLEEARERLERARPLFAQATDPMARGRLLRDLSAVYDNLGQHDKALASAEEGVAVLEIVGAPRDVVGVAFRLGGLLADRSEWPAAADALARAVRAAEAGLAARLDDTARENEQRDFPTLHRRAAYALARAGRVNEAAIALESGRARALRFRLGVDAADPDALDRLPADLRAAYLAASEQVAIAPLGAAGAAQRRNLAEVLTAVRSLPGLEDFATEFDLARLAVAAGPDAPLVYINPTPWGTLLLIVTGGGTPAVHARLLDRPTGLELYGQLMAAVNLDDPDRDDDDEPAGPSYLLAATGHGEEPDYLARAVEHTLAYVGASLARPIAGELASLGARAVTLILCGPLGSVPVGACGWGEAGETHRLIDRFTVSYAPSALVAASTRARARAQTSHRRLVALGDPNGDLDAAGPEVREVARRFDPDAVLAIGSAATISFLRSHAAGATHVHFACHAAGGLFDRDDSLLVLADRPLAIEDLTAIDALRPRLVVVSACQGAQSEIAGLPEEAVSIGAAMLAAGAAAAIAALWPVHDAATALLMVRLYEHLDQGAEPAEALRYAQIWLRDLTERDRRVFEDAHPLLRSELRRLPPRPDDPARSEPLGSLPGNARPFAHPDFWAGFVAMGA